MLFLNYFKNCYSNPSVAGRKDAA